MANAYRRDDSGEVVLSLHEVCNVDLLQVVIDAIKAKQKGELVSML
jgi:hypothetical protein